MSLPLGSVLEDRYRIVSILVEGAEGAVYRAEDLVASQDVAIKEARPAAIVPARRFERLARLLTRLRHRTLPRVIDHFVTTSGLPILVLSFDEREEPGHLLQRIDRLDEVRALISRRC